MTDMQDLKRRTSQRRRELDSQWGEARSVVARGKELQIEVKGLTETINDFERVTVLLNSLGEERQLKAQQTIEELVTRGMQTIFDDSLSFHIVQSVKGKTANVEFLLRTTRGETMMETPVLEARGGGLAVTIGFLLRVVVMLLRGGTREQNILVLDETFSHVSAEYLEPLGNFLREIVEKTEIQIIMVTHQPEFAEYADRVYRFSNQDGKTQVREDA
jgi:DNA repair exonuclease SbcCD ATPase subunit